MSPVPRYRGEDGEIQSAGGPGLLGTFMCGGSKIGEPQSFLCGMHYNGLLQLCYLHIVMKEPRAFRHCPFRMYM